MAEEQIEESKLDAERLAVLLRAPDGTYRIAVTSSHVRGRRVEFASFPIASPTPDAIRAAIDAAARMQEPPRVDDRNPRFPIEPAAAMMAGMMAPVHTTSPLGWNAGHSGVGRRDTLASMRKIDIQYVAERFPSRIVNWYPPRGSDLTAFALDEAAYTLHWMDSTGRMSTDTWHDLQSMAPAVFARIFATVASATPGLSGDAFAKAWKSRLDEWSHAKPVYRVEELLQMPRRKIRDAAGSLAVVIDVDGDIVYAGRSLARGKVESKIRELAESVGRRHYGWPFKIIGTP